MNPQRRFLTRSLTTLIAISAGQSLYALSPPPPPPPFQHIVTSWIGHDKQNYGNLYRLDLYADGKGFLTLTYFSSPPLLYRVRSWTLEKNAIVIPLEPIEPRATPIALSGNAYGGRLSTLHLKISYGNSNAANDVVLIMYREADVVRDLELAKARVQEQKANEK